MQVRLKCQLYRDGSAHMAGEVVDIDASLAARLAASGLVEALATGEAPAAAMPAGVPRSAPAGNKSRNKPAGPAPVVPRVSPEDEAAAAALDPDAMVED